MNERNDYLATAINWAYALGAIAVWAFVGVLLALGI